MTNRTIVLLLLVGIVACSQKRVAQPDLRHLSTRVSRLEADQAGRIQAGAALPLSSLSKTLIALAAESKQSVVEVIADPSIVKNSGAGFIYNEDGVILTNDHLVRVDVLLPNGDVKTYYKDKIIIKLYDGREVKGRLIGIEPNTDLAAVQIDIENLPKPLQLSTRTVQPGELAYTIGHPRGLSYSIEWRPISATYRSGSLPGTLLHQIGRGFFVGNSGGPLFDLEGKVIGMVYSTLNFKDKTDPKKTVVYAAIGWAIPADTLIKLTPELIEGKHKITGFIRQ